MSRSSASPGAWLRTRDRVATGILWLGAAIFVVFWVAAVARAFLVDLPSGAEGGSLAESASAALVASWVALLPGIMFGWLWGTRAGRDRDAGATGETRLGAIVWALIFTIAGARFLAQPNVIMAVLMPPATVLWFAGGVAVGHLASSARPRSNGHDHTDASSGGSPTRSDSEPPSGLSPITARSLDADD